MGTIVCQECNATIDHFEDEKVTVLYSSKCNCSKHEHNQRKIKIFQMNKLTACLISMLFFVIRRGCLNLRQPLLII